MTPQRIYRIAAMLSTLGLAGSSYAQGNNAPSDTLRRNLTVLTSEVVELDERMPQRLSFTMSRPPRLAPLEFAILPLPILSKGLDTPALSGLDSFQPMPPIRIPLGYITASLGLAYNAQLSAGLRPLNTSRRELDLHLAAHWSRYKHHHTPSLVQTLGQTAFRLGASYQERLAALHYKLMASYYTDSYPHYGVVSEPVAAGGNTQVWDINSVSPSVRSHLFRLGGELGSRLEAAQDWSYRIAPSLAIAGRGEAQDIELGLQAAMEYSLDPSRLALDADLAFWSCAPTAHDRFALGYANFAPSWRMRGQGENWSWTAQVGAKLSLGSRSRGGIGLSLAPYMAAGLSIADWIQLNLALDGGISGRPLSEVIDTAPYLRLTSPAALTHTPWHSKLDLELLPLSNLSIGLHGSFARHRNAEGIAAHIEGQALLRHKRYYEDTNHWSIGGSLKYRTKQYVEAQMRLTYHRWQTDAGERFLGGKPTLEAEARLSLTPNERSRFSLGYHFSGDYHYRLTSSHASEAASDLYMLGIVGRILGSATYQFTPKLSLLGYAHYTTTPNASPIVGFPLERFRASVGINLNF